MSMRVGRPRPPDAPLPGIRHHGNQSPVGGRIFVVLSKTSRVRHHLSIGEDDFRNTKTVIGLGDLRQERVRVRRSTTSTVRPGQWALGRLGGKSSSGSGHHHGISRRIHALPRFAAIADGRERIGRGSRAADGGSPHFTTAILGPPNRTGPREVLHMKRLPVRTVFPSPASRYSRPSTTPRSSAGAPGGTTIRKFGTDFFFRFAEAITPPPPPGGTDRNGHPRSERA